MKRLKPWQRNSLIVAVVVLVVAAAGIAVWNSGDYYILTKDQILEARREAFNTGKSAGEMARDTSAELSAAKAEGYSEGYDSGYADGLEYGKAHAEPSASQSEEEPSSSDQTSSTSSQSEQQTITVYITDTGSKYHRSGCRYLWNSSNAVTLSNAKSWGYSPCSVCDPPA